MRKSDKNQMETRKVIGQHGLRNVMVFNVIVVVSLLGIIEGGIALLLHYPPPFTAVLRVLSSYYTDHDRVIVQALPDCAVYDDELSYTLRPGSCRFDSYDYKTAIRVNSLGTRDDEESLQHPEVVVIGDSFTMGWGVEVENSYPHLIEEGCGMRTLNAGISSYGTVRELRLLKRIDTSSMKVLLIQYTDNDFDENRQYAEAGNQLEIMSKSDFDAMQKNHLERMEYYLGRHIIHFLPFFVNRVSKRLFNFKNNPVIASKQVESTALLPTDDAEMFLNVLENSDALSPGLRIIVYRINGRDKNTGEFADAIQEAIVRNSYIDPVASVETVDFSFGLTRDKFFVLDDHINESGHKYIAKKLMAILDCE